MSFVSIALLNPPYTSLTYRIPDWMPREMLCPGMRVAVPLGSKSLRCGIFLQEIDSPEHNDFVIKPVTWVLEKKPLLSFSYIHLLEQLSLHQMIPLGRILGSVLPLGLKTASGILRCFTPNGPRNYKLNILQKCPEELLSELASLWLKGKAEFFTSIAGITSAEFCTVCKDPPWPIRPSAKKQAELLNYLWECGQKSRRQIIEHFGSGINSVIFALLKQGLLKMGPASDIGVLSFSETEGKTEKTCLELSNRYQIFYSNEMNLVLPESAESEGSNMCFEHPAHMQVESFILTSEQEKLYMILVKI